MPAGFRLPVSSGPGTNPRGSRPRLRRLSRRPLLPAGDAAAVVEMRIFSGVVLTMSERKPVSTPGHLYVVHVEILPTDSPSIHRPFTRLARDRGDRIARPRDPPP